MANNIPMSRRGFIIGAVARWEQRATGWPYAVDGMSVLKRIAGSIAFLAMLTGSAGARDMVRELAAVEQAPAGKPFDYIVHVRNVPAIGYNPVVKEDRDRMALQTLRGQCGAGRVVGDDKIITEIWGITSSYPDYIVLIKCRLFKRGP